MPLSDLQNTRWDNLLTHTEDEMLLGEEVAIHNNDLDGASIERGKVKRFLVVQTSDGDDLFLYNWDTIEEVEADLVDKVNEEGWTVDYVVDLDTGTDLVWTVEVKVQLPAPV